MNSVNRRLSTPLVAATLIATGLLVLTTAQSFADSGGPQLPDIPEAHPQARLSSQIVAGAGVLARVEPTEDDIASWQEYADGLGVSVAEVLTRIRQQESLSALAQVYAEEFPENFVNYGFTLPEETEAGHDAYIVFVDQPPAEVFDSLAALPLVTQVRYGATATESEVEDISGEILEALQEELDSATIVAGLNHETGILEVDYHSDQELPAEQIDAIVTSAVSGQSPRVEVSIIRSDRLTGFTTEAIVEAGRALWQAGNPLCTSGFSAKIPGGSSGMVTAAHCAGPFLFRNISGVIQAHSYAPQTMDVRFFRTLSSNGHSTAPTVHRGAGISTMTVGSATAPANGNPVCKFGNTTGHNCSTVFATNKHVSGETVNGWRTYYRIAFAQHYITAGGDSGGPWFTNTVARGTHTGGFVYEGATRSAFSSISLVWDGLGLNVLTG